MSNDKIRSTGDRDATLAAGHHVAPSQLSAAGYNAREPFGGGKDGDRGIKSPAEKSAAQAESLPNPDGAGRPGAPVGEPTHSPALRRDVVPRQKKVRTLGAK